METRLHIKLNLRIDWSDLDLYGHVNNVAFFRYIQAARINYCDLIGLSSLNEQGRLGFMVASSQCQFRKPLYYPGEIDVFTGVDWVRNSSMQLGYTIMKEKVLIAEGQDVVVVYDHHNKTKVQIPETLRARIRATGQP